MFDRLKVVCPWTHGVHVPTIGGPEPTGHVLCKALRGWPSDACCEENCGLLTLGRLVLSDKLLEEDPTAARVLRIRKPSEGLE